MTNLSAASIEEVMKRIYKKRRTRNGKNELPGECTIPRPPVKRILSNYTLSNRTSERGIRDYVESQARGEKVQHSERVKTEHLLERDYDCWDVHTQLDRYWVITSPSNLYSQKYFPSLDFTLSFHVGLMARVMALQRGAPDDAQNSRLMPVWRRWEEAASAFDSAEEAEEFQAVGMRCRECLIHLVQSIGKAEMIPVGQERPKRSDVIQWSEHIANAVAASASAEHIRGHLKGVAKSAWQLAQWLTHANGAGRSDADFVLDATHTVIAAFGSAAMRFESGSPDRCPNCGSYRIAVGYNPGLPQPYVSGCEKCAWRSPEMR
jgi:hypothetical protein